MKKYRILNFLFLLFALMSFAVFFYSKETEILLLAFLFVFGASMTSGQNDGYWRGHFFKTNKKTSIVVSDGLTLELRQNENEKFVPVIRKKVGQYGRSGFGEDSSRIFLIWGQRETLSVLNSVLDGKPTKINGVAIWCPAEDWILFHDDSTFSIRRDDLVKVKNILEENGWIGRN